MPENYQLISESALCLLFHRLDSPDGSWQRFVLEVKKSRVKKRRFQIGWNGERLAGGPELDSARAASAFAVAWVEDELRRLHPKKFSPIEATCIERQIPFLVHFTQVNNLSSIFSRGIHPRGRLREDIEIKWNDSLRLDGHTEATSLSITFPNNRMFYKYRIANPNTSWAVLVLDRSILWTRNCAYCPHNAADSRITRRALGELRTHESFLEMFSEMPHIESRLDQRLFACDPTDIQAEVLVFNIIPSKLILEVLFETPEIMAMSKISQAQQVGPIFRVAKSFFSDRKYIRSTLP